MLKWQSFLRPVSRDTFLGLVAFNILVRLYLASLPGYVDDVEMYRDWALGSALWGIPSIYEKSNIDYPPVLTYVLNPAGHLYLWEHPEIRPDHVRMTRYGEYFIEVKRGLSYRSWSNRPVMPPIPDSSAQPMPSSRYFNFLVKSPLIVFDLLLAALLYALVSRGSWGEGRREVGWCRLASLLYLWQPSVLFVIGYWGQVDSIHSLFAVAALALLGSRYMFGSGALLTLAGLAKPLAAPLVPLLALAAGLRGRGRGFAMAGLGGISAAILVLMPFIVTGRGPDVLLKFISDLDAMPYASVNAHNSWWLLGGWRDATEAWIGPLSRKMVGFALFVAFYAALLVRSRHWLRRGEEKVADFQARLLVLGAAVTAGFFFLSTHMHENHMFMALPMLLAVAGRNRHLAYLALGAGAVGFLNAVVHDPDLPFMLPGFLGKPVELSLTLAGRPFTPVQLIASYANSVATALVVFGICRAAWKLGDSLPSITHQPPPIPE